MEVRRRVRRGLRRRSPEHRINRSPYLLFYARDDDAEDLSGEWSADLRGFVERDNEAALNERRPATPPLLLTNGPAFGPVNRPPQPPPGGPPGSSSAAAAAGFGGMGGGAVLRLTDDLLTVDTPGAFRRLVVGRDRASSETRRGGSLRLNLRRVVVARPRDFCRGRVHGADRHGDPRAPLWVIYSNPTAPWPRHIRPRRRARA